MILFLTLIYVGLLAAAVKLNLIRLTLFWKLSPVIWMVILLVGLFIPMQFWAPAGQVVVVQYSVPIVPNVSGQVTEVAVQPNQQVREGDLLFRIDAEPFEAARDQVAAQLELARIQLGDSEVLRKQSAISESRYERDQAQVKQLQAGLRAAEYNLRQTEVKAPADGYVTNLALRAGARVASFPIAPAMTFVDESEQVIGAQVAQSYLRYIESGLTGEVTYKMYPGQVFPVTVDYSVAATSQGQVLPSGNMVAPRDLQAVPYMVRLQPVGDSPRLPAGAVGSVAIYSDTGQATHIIRKVMIRMDAFMNYVVPF